MRKIWLHFNFVYIKVILDKEQFVERIVKRSSIAIHSIERFGLVVLLQLKHSGF